MIETQNLSLATGEKLIIESIQETPSVVFVDTAGVKTNAWNKIKFGSKFWKLHLVLTRLTLVQFQVRQNAT